MHVVNSWEGFTQMPNFRLPSGVYPLFLRVYHHTRIVRSTLTILAVHVGNHSVGLIAAWSLTNTEIHFRY